MQTTDTNLETTLPLRLWTVEEYQRLAEFGILTPDEKVELIAGQIIRKMSPQKTPHAVTVTRVRRLLDNLLQDEALVITQLPVTLNDFSEPEPDIAVVIPDELRYLANHPTPADIHLLIEIADTTLKTDTGIKAKEYAKSGIKDYWVLDLKNRQLLVFRQPTETDYQNKQTLPENSSISPLQFPQINLQIQQMLPPAI
ncbi:MAG TPA: Uma2 family endonuclease [Halomicronema sp.]